MFNFNRLYGLSILRWVFRYIWRGFEAFANFLDRFLFAFAMTLLIGMWGLLLFNAIARWTEWFTINWSLEIVGYMIAWSIFVMAGPVARANQHINVNFFPVKLLGEKKGAAFMYVAENLVGMGICIFLSIHSYRFVDRTYHLGWKEVSVSGGWEYPMWIIRSGILVGFITLSIFYFERTVRWIIDQFIKKRATGEQSLSEITVD